MAWSCRALSDPQELASIRSSLTDEEWTRWCVEAFRRQARTRFLEIKDNLDVVFYSLIRVRDPDLASELYLRIKEDNESFAHLSRVHSEGPERECGGLVGPVPIGRSTEQISSLLKTMKINELKGPISLGMWQVILRLDDRIPALFSDFESDLAVQIAAEQMQSEIGSDFQVSD